MIKVLENCGFKNVPKHKRDLLMYLWLKLTKETIIKDLIEQQHYELTVSLKHKETKRMYALRIVNLYNEHQYDIFIKQITLQKRAERVAIKVHDYYTNEQKNIGVVLMDNMTKSFADVFVEYKKNKGTLGMQYLEFLVTGALALNKAQIITTDIHYCNDCFAKAGTLRLISFGHRSLTKRLLS